MDVAFPIDLQAKLSPLAAQQGRDSSALIVEAVERMLDHDEWFLREVDKGLAQVESGQTLSHEEAADRLNKYINQKKTTA
jgi:predicted transcriptional regulator